MCICVCVLLHLIRLRDMVPGCLYFARIRSWSYGGWSVFSSDSQELTSQHTVVLPTRVRLTMASTVGPVALLELLLADVARFQCQAHGLTLMLQVLQSPPPAAVPGQVSEGTESRRAVCLS